MKAKAIKDILKSSATVAIDTMVFIYLLEKHPAYFSTVKQIFDKMESGKIKISSSVISYLETLSSPKLDSAKIVLYKEFFLKAKNLYLMNLTPEIADISAFLRRSYRLRTPDAIQIATAINSKADFFLSNDESFKKVSEIKILVLKDFV